MTELSEIFFPEAQQTQPARPARAAEPLSAAVLVGRLRAVRRKHRLISAGHGLALLLIAGLLLLVGGMLLDWSLDLPIWARAGLLTLDAAVLGWLAWRYLLLAVWHAPDDGSIALMIEDAWPDFRSRLISAIQLARPGGMPRGASGAIARRMIEQTTELAQGVRFEDVVKTNRLWQTWPAAVVLIAAMGVAFFRGQPVSGQLLERAFLANIPVPHFTEVEVIQVPPIVARGSTVNFKALARRIIPASGTVVVQYPDGRAQKLSLDRTDQPIRGAAAFARSLADVQDTFDYSITLNDNTTPWYHVEVQPPPAIAAAAFSVTYPPYIHRGVENQSPDSLAILRGSTLHLRITATKKLKSTALHLVGTDITVPLQRDLNNWAIASADVPVMDNITGIAVQLVDTVGLTNGDADVYPVKVIPDRPPTVAITYPKSKQELATRKAKFLIDYSTGDDFGLDSLSLQYRVDGGAVTTLPIKINRGDTSTQGECSLDISTIAVPAGKADLIGSTIEYWLVAADGNSVTGPGITQSEHLLIKCVTEDEKRAELAEQEAQIIGAFGNTAADQQSVTNDVGDMVKEKAKP